MKDQFKWRKRNEKTVVFKVIVKYIIIMYQCYFAQFLSHIIHLLKGHVYRLPLHTTIYDESSNKKITVSKYGYGSLRCKLHCGPEGMLPALFISSYNSYFAQQRVDPFYTINLKVVKRGLSESIIHYQCHLNK